ncbi:hypothetical protein BJV78DRAFT_857759 [Lactifluus subvellereus]|nr:hypothetical protein BJV78DRAFT_857759 [Lactifluus subvellereus]
MLPISAALLNLLCFKYRRPSWRPSIDTANWPRAPARVVRPHRQPVTSVVGVALENWRNHIFKLVLCVLSFVSVLGSSIYVCLMICWRYRIPRLVQGTQVPRQQYLMEPYCISYRSFYVLGVAIMMGPLTWGDYNPAQPTSRHPENFLSMTLRARSVAPVSKPGLPNRRPNSANRLFSKIGMSIGRRRFRNQSYTTGPSSGFQAWLEPDHESGF